MTALIARSVRRMAGTLVTILVIVFGFQMALVAMAASIADAGDFDRLARIVPAALQPAIAPALMSFGRMTTIGYFDALIVMLVVQWAIYAATEPAGEIEQGLIDLVLSRPLPRHWVITRSLVVMMGSVVVLLLAMAAGTAVGLALMAPAGADWPDASLIGLMMTHLTVLSWAFGAAALAASACLRRRSAALSLMAIAAVALYLVDFVGLVWSPAERVAHLSPFFYFHGGAILTGTTNVTRDLTVLLLLTAASTALAYWRFAQRDL